MKKIYLVLLLAYFCIGNAQINWRRSSATTNFPSWMSTGSYERGIGALGDKMYVVTRNATLKIKVIDGTNGADLSDISPDPAIVSGGYFPLNDVEVSTNGAILACNMVLNTNTDTFKIYKWDSETAVPSAYISYTNTDSAENLRLGDSFSVTGDIAGNAVIMAAGQVQPQAGVHKVVRWIVTNGVLGSPTIINVQSLGISTNVICVAPIGVTAASDLYVKVAGKALVKCNASGVILETDSKPVLASSGTDIKYIDAGTKRYIAAYVPGTATEQSKLIDVTSGLSTAFTVSSTPQLGAVSNGNSNGGVGVKTTLDPVDGLNTITIYTLGCNNGISGTTLVNNGTTVVLSNNDFNAIDKQNAVKIFPNPTSNEFQIAIDTNLEKEAQASIYDVQGRQVKSAKIAAKNQTVSIEDLTAGYYLVKIINGTTTSTTKLLKK
jgi:hypothetical protein